MYTGKPESQASIRMIVQASQRGDRTGVTVKLNKPNSSTARIPVRVKSDKKLEHDQNNLLPAPPAVLLQNLGLQDDWLAFRRPQFAGVLLTERWTCGLKNHFLTLANCFSCFAVTLRGKLRIKSRFSDRNLKYLEVL